ncbi:host specificity protein J [Halomonas sp. V046]|uniref:host specificity protein J n=1 Tax=Halomonas sp. V046 TaxID=3459611 RepID=UPI004044A862
MTDLVVYGEKGGKGGGGDARTPREAPNTLRSTSKARVVDIIAEGPIVGLVGGLKGIYLDDTPLQDEGGSYNFSGVTVHTRTGEPDQSHIPGFPAIETASDVSTEVTKATPVIRTVTNPEADAVRVTVQLQALSYQNVENGDLLPSEVAVAIDVRPNGGSWSEKRYDTIKGKTTSPYQRSYRVDLTGQGPWDVRVRRITPDNGSATLRNQTYWSTFTEIIDAKLQYPDTALVGIEVDAQDFGSQIPARSYDVKGLIVKVPTNYNPVTRAYSGLWNGAFKLAWTDNPAWCFLDLATSTRYGAGLESVDKWGLYQIAQYCDELIPDGFGDEEPRFTFNTVLSSRKEAITVLDTLASAFRGMTYWGANTVMATADMPADPVKLVSPANVVDGEFEYSGTALKARHSVALVSWNDPADNYRLQVEVVEDADAIQQFGWKQVDVTAVGCTSRGQAHRLGKWMLYSERAETETVTYQASVDHADVRPGDIIAVNDPSTAGARLSGRIAMPGLSELTLDQVPPEASGSNWFLDVLLPTGGIERREVDQFRGDRITLVAPLSAEPIRGAIWMLSSQDVEPRKFRVLSVVEQESAVYQVTAVEHDPTKYDRVEQGLNLPDEDYTLIPTGPVVAPYSITVEASKYLAGGTEHQKITVSWTPSDDARVVRYIAEVQGPNDVSWGEVFTGTGTSFDILDAAPGEWQIRVHGVTGTGTKSPWAYRTTNVAGLLLPTPPDSIDIRAGTFEITLIPNGLYPGQMWEFWRSNAALSLGQITSNAVRVGVGPTLTDTDLTPDTTYFYYVRGVNAYGVSSWYPVQATTENDPEKIMSVISGQIKQTDLFSDLSQNIDGLNSSWVLNVTGGGRVAGFGTAYDDDQDVFDFGVLADRFYIAQPGDGAAEVIPFIFTNNTLYLKEALIQYLTFTKLKASDGSFIVENGKVKASYIQADELHVDYGKLYNIDVQNAHIRNAAITNAKIANAAITTAKIGIAQIDTLRVAGNAITVPAGAARSGNLGSTGNWRDLLSVYINAEGNRVFGWFSAVSRNDGNYFRWVVDGSVKHEIGGGANSAPNGIIDCGTQYGVTVKVQTKNALGTSYLDYSSLLVMGAKR